MPQFHGIHRRTLILPFVAVVLAVGLAITGWRASGRREAWAQANDALRAAGVPDSVAERVQDLGATAWKTREGAERWLILHRELWQSSVPASWQPQDAEARWRWKRVLETANLLAGLRQLLADKSTASDEWRFIRLHRELGDSFLHELTEVFSDSSARVRQRTVRLLDSLPGVDPRPWLGAVEDDPSPWVRSTVYEVAIRRDRRWASRLLLDALERHESDALLVETARALQRVSVPQAVPLLRRKWEKADDDARTEIALALCHSGCIMDRAVLHWMLASDVYRLIMPALSFFDAHAVPADAPYLCPLLSSEFREARVRSLAVLQARGDRRWALDLLPVLEEGDPDVVRAASQCLVKWGACDYFADVAAAARRIPDATVSLVPAIRKGEAQPHPGPAIMSEAGLTPAVGSPHQH